MSNLIKRSEAKKAYCWNLKDIYISDEEWERDYNEVKNRIDYYKKLKNMTNLTVGKPLLFNEDDIKTLVKSCRKENCTNIWIMHPTRQKQLFNSLKTIVCHEDVVLTIDDEIHFDEKKSYHVVVLLMSEGNHYHELLEKIPECVSVSEILPHQKEVIKMIEDKNK